MTEHDSAHCGHKQRKAPPEPSAAAPSPPGTQHACCHGGVSQSATRVEKDDRGAVAHTQHAGC